MTKGDSASSFETCIMTRGLSIDSITKGQSSFMADMAELRAILKRAKDGSTPLSNASCPFCQHCQHRPLQKHCRPQKDLPADSVLAW